MSTKKNSFEQRASQRQPGLIAEFVAFLIQNKKWWLAPIIVAMLLLSLMAVATSSAAAPFIYSFF